MASLALILIFLIFGLIAIKKGNERAEEQWNGQAVHVQLNFKSLTPSPYGPELLNANNEQRLSLIAQTKDLVIVFEPVHSKTSKRTVFVVARADLASVGMWN